jgi:hypothetical protein
MFQVTKRKKHVENLCCEEKEIINDLIIFFNDALNIEHKSIRAEENVKI